MEKASTAVVPGYLPVDGHDLHVALTAVDRKLSAMYPGRLGSRELMGYFMGAFESLYLAATEGTNHSPLIQFDRYVAVNTPVRLLHGVSVLDQFYQAPLAWQAAEQAEDLENTFLKVAALSKNKLTPQTSLPFNAIESKFLIGFTFRFILRDIIYSSQRRHNEGVLRHAILSYRREPVYREIMKYSYEDYFTKFVVPYYKNRGMAQPVADTLDKAEDLRTYDAGFRANSKVRVIVNQNDFLLGDGDLDWLRGTFRAGGPDCFQGGRAPGKSFQSNGAKDDFESAGNGEARAIRRNFRPVTSKNGMVIWLP